MLMKSKNAHSNGNKISYGLIEECDFPADIHYDDEGSIILTIDAREIRTNSKIFFRKKCNCCCFDKHNLRSRMGLFSRKNFNI